MDFPQEAAPTIDFPRRVQRNGRMRRQQPCRLGELRGGHERLTGTCASV